MRLEPGSLVETGGGGLEAGLVAEREEGGELKSPDELMQEIAVLRDRISKLSAASLRISASLDLDTILSEVVESARALTGAPFGGISTIGDSGQPEDFVSSGFTPDEHRRLMDWADGPRLFEHFKNLEGSLRLTDLHGYVRALGFPPPSDHAEDRPGNAYASSGRACRQLLSGRNLSVIDVTHCILMTYGFPAGVLPPIMPPGKNRIPLALRGPIGTVGPTELRPQDR